VLVLLVKMHLYMCTANRARIVS